MPVFRNPFAVHISCLATGPKFSSCCLFHSLLCDHGHCRTISWPVDACRRYRTRRDNGSIADRLAVACRLDVCKRALPGIPFEQLVVFVSTLTTTAAFLALVAALTSLIVSAGTARRVNRLVGSRVGLTPQVALPNGSSLPNSVAAIVAPIPNGNAWLLLVAGGGCPACQNLARALNDSYSRIGQLPIVVIDSSRESEPKFDTFITIPIRVVPDEAGAFREALGVRGIPHSFVLNGDRIADQLIGDNFGQLLSKIATQRLGL